MKKKKEIILVSAAVFTLMIFIVGATYAYFAGNIGSDGNTNINVETATVDLLSFNIEKDIYIDVVATDFVKGSGNKSDSTKAHATLLATNSQSIESSKNKYNVYFVIEENDFEYTTTDALPEILLKVTDPNGNEVENITGLVHTENGFDITTRTGGFLISADYEITALRGESTTQDWNVEVTFVNLDSDQNKNMGKTLSGKLYMTKKQMATYELPAVNSIEPTTTYNSIKATMKINEGSTAIDKYYFGIEQASSDETGYINNLNTKVIQLAATDVKFVETDKPEYTFTNLSENTTYKVYS